MLGTEGIREGLGVEGQAAFPWKVSLTTQCLVLHTSGPGAKGQGRAGSEDSPPACLGAGKRGPVGFLVSGFVLPTLVEAGPREDKEGRLPRPSLLPGSDMRSQHPETWQKQVEHEVGCFSRAPPYVSSPCA